MDLLANGILIIIVDHIGYRMFAFDLNTDEFIHKHVFPTTITSKRRILRDCIYPFSGIILQVTRNAVIEHQLEVLHNVQDVVQTGNYIFLVTQANTCICYHLPTKQKLTYDFVVPENTSLSLFVVSDISVHVILRTAKFHDRKPYLTDHFDIFKVTVLNDKLTVTQHFKDSPFKWLISLEHATTVKWNHSINWRKIAQHDLEFDDCTITVA
jgi:hypothetical protein